MSTDAGTAAVPRALRGAMVDGLRDRGVLRDPRVEAAMFAVPSHLFIPGFPAARAYSGESVATRTADI